MLKIISIEEAMGYTKKVYRGITTQEQFIVADTFCELLLAAVVPENLDELIDCISMCQETARLIIRVEKVNEKFRDNGINDGPVRIEHKRRSHKSVSR